MLTRVFFYYGGQSRHLQTLYLRRQTGNVGNQCDDIAFNACLRVASYFASLSLKYASGKLKSGQEAFVLVAVGAVVVPCFIMQILLSYAMRQLLKNVLFMCR